MMKVHSSPTSNSFSASDLLRPQDKSLPHPTKIYRSACMTPSCQTGLLYSWFILTFLGCD